ncbi:MAG: aspartate aminotransferase family protein [Bacteroidota bacterium]|nr:aspartate aminotransferase family protein [Bacteroidota bacterium]
MSSLKTNFLELLAQTSPYPLALDIIHAEGCILRTRDGTEYLDLIAGLAVNNVGHRHQKVIQAIKDQCDRYLHVIPYGEFIQEPQVRFAKAITAQLPASLNNVYFVNSGTEAIEGSLKLAKRITGRTHLAACHGSYHGSTHGSLSITGNEYKKFRNRPLLPGIEFIRFNNEEVLDLITDRFAAVVVEPIQGDAGVRVPREEWLQALRAKCDRTGTQLIFDEVQTGFGRTGSLFAFQKYQVIPDILVLGKALGGGMPMGAFISSKEKMDLFTHDPILGHITTFGGHPIPCVAGHAALEVLLEEDLVINATVMGALFKELLQHQQILEVRGEGLMLAVELGNADRVQKVVKGALENGVLGFWFLSCPTAFRIAPPLMISEDQVRLACSVLIDQFDQ